MKRIALVSILLFATSTYAMSGAIRAVSVGKGSMNPTLGEFVAVAVSVAKPGQVTLLVIDRDGFVTRTLARNAAMPGGVGSFNWDGRNDAGQIVPNEAYSLRIEWTDGHDRDVYFPAGQATSMISVPVDYYAARTATVTYTLAVPSRVHMQAGIATKNPRTGAMEGPVMKTIVNREPRLAGKVAEVWNGMDESGTINVSELRNFVAAIAVTPLPENSVIVYGSRGPSFVQMAAARAGESFLSARVHSSHAQHAGLTVLEDVSPAMDIAPLNATWSETDRAWILAEKTLRLRVSLTGPSAAVVAKQPGALYRFVEGKLVAQSPRPESHPTDVDVPVTANSGVQMVTLNWRSDHGPVAANTIRVRTVRGGGATAPKGLAR